MPLANYGVLKGRPIAKKLGAGGSPHYQVHIVDDETDYRIAVNVKSKLSPSELEYIVVDNFEHPILDDLAGLASGFTGLERAPGGVALDYIRGNLFDRDAVRALPHNVPGPDNDLNEKIDSVIQRAISDESAEVYAFGERWGPENNTKDKHFGFLPGNGIHDIHMNQGNHQSFRRQDGVWQDGGMVAHFPAVDGAAEQWVAVFLKFQSQAWHTDDIQGHALAQPAPGGETPVEPQGDVRILAALVNPLGPGPESETVTILNRKPQELLLNGWALADKNKNKQALHGSLAAGEARLVPLSQDVQLSNKGGIITLLHPDGLKVDGVSYTKAQAREEGWTVVF